MISIQEAQQIIHNNTSTNSKITTLKLTKSLGYYIAKDVLSDINMPPFRQSAMDGYAVNLHDKPVYNLIDEVKAGDNANPVLQIGDAVRIFTGAPVPDTANAIVIQEHTTIEQSQLTTHQPILPNANIRPLGEQIKTGDIAIKKGHKITPATIGYLASLGMTHIEVYEAPKMAIVVTGNELVPPGATLAYGQIYESNAAMLSATLASLGYNNFSIHSVKDDYDSTEALLKEVLDNNDFVLISGGISVGDYDFVGKALLNLGVEQLFYKIKQKPGKPLFFGKKEQHYVFALPGNPASALSCFYMYVFSALEKFSGHINPQVQKVMAPSQTVFHKKGDRPQFLKAIYHNNEVTILEGQASSMLHTFALANALAYIPEAVNTVHEGDLITTYLLPNINI